jgi:hypothetical protein
MESPLNRATTGDSLYPLDQVSISNWYNILSIRKPDIVGRDNTL